MSAPDGSKPLLNLPFHYAIDDAMFFSFAWLNSENEAQRMMDPEHVSRNLVGGLRAASTGAAAISTSACTPSCRAARCASPCSTA